MSENSSDLMLAILPRMQADLSNVKSKVKDIRTELKTLRLHIAASQQE